MFSIQELKPNQKDIDVYIKVEELTKEREVTTKFDNRLHRVVEALVGDETGCIYLSIWDEDIDEIKSGKYYKITKAYTSIFKNSMRLNKSNKGNIEENQGNFEINTSNNMSLMEL